MSETQENYRITHISFPIPLDEQINLAFDELKEDRIALSQAVDDLAEAKTRLAIEESQAWKAGIVEGKNDRERRAWLDDYLAVEAGQVETAEAEKREAELSYDLARYEVDRLKLMVQLEGKE